MKQKINAKLKDIKDNLQWQGPIKFVYRILKNNWIKTIVRLKKALNLGSYPDFIIIGVMKGGTTSLFRYLMEHPDIKRGSRKEVHFFDRNPNQDADTYKANFPIFRQGKITGEATPEYIFHPLAAERMHKLCPNAKLILVLRNPVDRAFSHYNMEINRLHENKSFEEAMALEEKRLNGLTERVAKGGKSKVFTFQSYLARGRYIKQVQNLFKYFKPEQVLILNSKDLFADPQKACSQAFKFLGVPDFKISKPKIFNVSRYKSKMKPETRKKLSAYFKPYNQKLYKLLNRDFGWD